MTKPELIALVRRAQLEGQEHPRVEHKRSWWKLRDPKQRDEFRKDVAAMANALPRQEDPAHIIIGLKCGTLHDAPLPCDEADLQQILGAIDPIPLVRFDEVDMNGTRVTVLTLEPPFDPPHVVRVGARHHVFVRRGTSISTADRPTLDMYYRSTRCPEVDLTLEAEDPRFAPESGTDVLLLSNAPGEAFEQLEARLLDDVAVSRRAVQDNPGIESVQAATAAFVADVAHFREEVMADINRFHSWRLDRYGETAAARVRMVLRNRGSCPANGIRVRLQIPTWLGVADCTPDPDTALSIPVPPDFESLLRPAPFTGPEASMIARFAGLQRQLRTSGSGWGALATAAQISGAADIARVAGNHVQIEEGCISWDLRELDHAHEMRSSPLFFLCTPTAPPGVHQLMASLFHRDLREYEDIPIRVRVPPEYPG